MILLSDQICHHRDRSEGGGLLKTPCGLMTSTLTKNILRYFKYIKLSFYHTSNTKSIILYAQNEKSKNRLFNDAHINDITINEEILSFVYGH